MKILLWSLPLLLLLLVGFMAVSWVMSTRFLVPQPYSLMPEFEIVAVEAEVPAQAQEGEGSDESLALTAGERRVYLVTLPVLDDPPQFGDATKEGVYNLLWGDGYGRLGPALEVSAASESANDPAASRTVVRRVTSVVGEPPRQGSPARLDNVVFRRNPQADHGIDYEELELDGEAGRLYAWWVPNDPQRAVLALHGRRRADRTETLRIMPTLVEEGWSVMALAYRNHDRSDPSPDGYFHYGHTEAEDALTALLELSRRGVEEVVLYGFSMGGAVALETEQRWPEDAPRLLGIVLDSPLLDPRTVISHVAATDSPPVPGPVARVALSIGAMRAGIDWGELDQRRTAPGIEVPLLLIAGTEDATIPIELVDEFAARVSSPLEYMRLEGVDHVEAWNQEREAYERAVTEFLQQVEEQPRLLSD